MTQIRHLGIIMDGNRRWAKAQAFPTFEGHRAGYKKAEEVVRWTIDAKISVLTLFAFSTENWQRAKEEVSFLMDIFVIAFSENLKKLQENNIRIKVIGRKGELPEKLQEVIREAEEKTKNNNALTLNIALNYGGRQELIDAFRSMVQDVPAEITEKEIEKHLYTTGLPDPDLIIRTSGEQRLSGFLTWQSAYSELYFVQRHWPEFSKEDFDAVLEDYAKRERRFGR